MTKLPTPTPDQRPENAELAPLAQLEAALETACHALVAGHQRPALDQDWIPPWRLPETGKGWVIYWILSAAAELREALLAYGHATKPHGQLQLLPDSQADSDCPF